MITRKTDDVKLCVNCAHSQKINHGLYDAHVCSLFVDVVQGDPILCSDARADRPLRDRCGRDAEFYSPKVSHWDSEGAKSALRALNYPYVETKKLGESQ